VFQGYDKDPNLDYIFTEEYDQFSSVSFALRPMDLSFHALSQSGFLFNGSITGGLFSGYMIALEAREDELTGARCADLRLYHAAGADLEDADAFADLSARTLVSTYVLGITEADTWPIYIRVEATAAGFQVFVDGQLRTRDLDPLDTDTGFGFFTGYIGHDCPDLTVVAFSNMRIEAPWESVNAQATVHFLEYGTNAVLADPQTRNGVTGQYYYITPPGFAGYSLIETNQRLLDPIIYFTDPACNETFLYYVKQSASYKEATYEGLQNNGTAKNPVLVETGKTIDYTIHAGGNGTEYKGDWIVKSLADSGKPPIQMSQFGGTLLASNRSLLPSHGSPPTNFWWWDEYNIAQGQQNANGSWKPQSLDLIIGTESTTRDGRMTLESNYSMSVGYAAATAANYTTDEVVVGFTSPANRKLGSSGGQGIEGESIPYSPACNVSGANHTYSAGNSLTSHDSAYASCACTEERYIKVTYNGLKLDAGYLLDLIINSSTNSKPNDFYFVLEGRDSKGGTQVVPIYRNPLMGARNGNSVRCEGITARVPNPLGVPAEYVDPYEVDPAYPNGVPFIYPKADGTISLTVKRIHNNDHDYNIFIGTGQVTERARQTVMRVIDYLPPGVTYVPGSSGVYEANLEIINNPDGSTTLLWWDFGVLPPDGIHISFQAIVEKDGYFPNNAYIQYFQPCPIPSTPTNTTYHMTGMTAVTEHFLDFNNHSVSLKADRTIHMPRGEDYTTSIVSMGEILYKGDTYSYKGYRIVGVDPPGTVREGEPPKPTIPNVTSHREIELFFAKNPVVTVEFRYVVNGTELKACVDFPVTFGDPFFLPDSAREPIPYDSSRNYNYISFSDDNGVTVVGMPNKPVFTCVTEDRTVIVYFDLVNAVTVHYVEYQNPANVLQNDDYYLVPQGGGFSVAPVTPPMISSMGKRYIYEGYSLPGGSFTPGMPPDFTNVTSDEEITLYYSTTYLITVKWHRGDIPYADGLVYDELLPVNTFTIRAGDPFAMTAVPTIIYDGVTYDSMDAYKWTSDAQPANPGSPTINAVYGDYTIIFLYEPVTDELQYTVVVMFREYGNTTNMLAPDQCFVLNPGAPFNLSAPPAIPGWTYFAYEIDRGDITIGQPPANPLFPSIRENHVVILQYIPEGAVIERFRELDNIPHVLAPDRTVKLPSSGIYNPDSWIPPPDIYVDDEHTYVFRGYQVNGGPVVRIAHSELPRPMAGVLPGDTVTYLYRCLEPLKASKTSYVSADDGDTWGDADENFAAEDAVLVRPGNRIKYDITVNNPSKINLAPNAYDVLFVIDWSGSMRVLHPYGDIGYMDSKDEGVAIDYAADIISDMCDHIFNNYPGSRFALLGMNTNPLLDMANYYDTSSAHVQFETAFGTDTSAIAGIFAANADSTYAGDDVAVFLAAATAKMKGLSPSYGGGNGTVASKINYPRTDQSRTPVVVLISDFQINDVTDATSTPGYWPWNNCGLAYGSNYWANCLGAEADAYAAAFGDGILMTLRMDNRRNMTETPFFSSAKFNALMANHVAPYMDGSKAVQGSQARYDAGWRFVKADYNDPYAVTVEKFKSVFMEIAPLGLAAATITDVVPEGLEIVGTNPKAIVNGQSVKWILDELPEGNSVFTIEVIVRDGGPLYANTAGVQITDQKPVTTNEVWHRLLPEVKLHVRQVVLGDMQNVALPLMGFLTISNDGGNLNAACNSGLDGSTVLYTTYALRPNDDPEYLFRLIVPQNYTYQGHIASGEDGEHDSAQRILPGETPNGQILLTFDDAGELWLTLYIEPYDAPNDHSDSYATNDFGRIFPTV